MYKNVCVCIYWNKGNILSSHRTSYSQIITFLSSSLSSQIIKLGWMIHVSFLVHYRKQTTCRVPRTRYKPYYTRHITHGIFSDGTITVPCARVQFIGHTTQQIVPCALRLAHSHGTRFPTVPCAWHTAQLQSVSCVRTLTHGTNCNCPVCQGLDTRHIPCFP